MTKATPLRRLPRGQVGTGLWVDPAYHRLGYAGAPDAVLLRPEVAERVTAVAAGLAELGIGLLLWDGWRSRALQAALWDEYRARIADATGLSGPALDERTAEFISRPDSGDPPPPHATGATIDLTLCDTTGGGCDMGGEFDELTDRSHPEHYERGGLTDAEAAYRDRRRLLNEAMTERGFWRFRTEWWHFEYGTHSWAVARGVPPLYGEVTAP